MKSRYFKGKELACPCCGALDFNQATVDRLDIAREFADVPFIINSGYRCEEHNTAVGGKITSSHTDGYAVDIKAVDSRSRNKILAGLIGAGFNRIGIAKSFIHADDDPFKDSEVTWLY